MLRQNYNLNFVSLNLPMSVFSKLDHGQLANLVIYCIMCMAVFVPSCVSFLAVQDSSISDIVCWSVGLSLGAN